MDTLMFLLGPVGIAVFLICVIGVTMDIIVPRDRRGRDYDDLGNGQCPPW